MPHVPPRPVPARRWAMAVAAALVALGGIVPASAPAIADETDDARYIVQLAEQPLAADEVLTTAHSGAAAFESRQALAAGAALERQQRTVAKSVGADIEQSFTTALNGFSTTLSADEATDLAARDDVLSVSRERVFTLDTVTSADALGLTGAGGVWESVGGAADAGAGVVVGIIDSGIAPENPSFAGEPLAAASADRTVPHLDGTAADGGIAVSMEKSDGGSFSGECEASTTFAMSSCSTKIVGARVFDDGPTSGTIFVDNSTEYFSPRDASGHGSHTSAIAAGNAGVPATVGGVGPVDISGVAPAAKVAVYKACWLDDFFGTGRCSETDLVGAIDAAVRDGVDVINYSIGSGSGDATLTGPVDLALLRAASAGVFVAASAGNSGPDASTVDHTEPWVTTVAASTTERGATVVMGGREYRGVSSTVYGQATTDAPLVQDRSNPASLYCRAGSLDERIVRGAVVLCLRPSSPDSAAIRLAQSAEVLRAGGVGMILANTATSSSGLAAEAHSVPTVHVAADAGAALAAAAGSRVSFLPSAPSGTPPTDPAIAEFSSRGPALTGYANILKPDLAAPGVQVLSATTNAPGGSGAFRILSGTSMASPQVAGLAALALGDDPEASPAAIRSALMTTARAAVGDVGSFAGGAGVVLPSAFLEPGFVYDAGADDWNGYLNGLGVETGTRATPVHGSDLNQASLAIGSLVGSRTVTRTVTSTGAGVFVATAGVPGIDVTVEPAKLVFTRAGQRARYTVTVSRADADLDTFANGAITWSGTTTSAATRVERAVVSTFPVVVRPVTVSTEPALAELPALPDSGPTPDPDPAPSPSPSAPGDNTPAPEPGNEPGDDISYPDADDGAVAGVQASGGDNSSGEAVAPATALPTPTPTPPIPTATPSPGPAPVPAAAGVDDGAAGSALLPLVLAGGLLLVLATAFAAIRIRRRHR